jgi:hypothetical protein
VALLAGATGRGEIAALVDTLDMFDVASAAAGGIDLGRLLWIRGQGPGARGQDAKDREMGGRGGNVAERAIDGDQRQGIEARGAGLRSAVGDGGTYPSCTPTASVDGKPAPRVVHQSDARGRHPALAAEIATQAGAWERAVDRAIKALNLVLQAGGFGLVALDLAEVPAAVVRRLPFTIWLRLQRVIEGSETACVLLGAEPVARSAGGVTIALRSRDQEPGARGQGSEVGGQWLVADDRTLAGAGRIRAANREDGPAEHGLLCECDPCPPADKRRARLFLGLDVEARLSRARWPDTTPCRFRFGAATWSLAPGS